MPGEFSSKLFEISVWNPELTDNVISYGKIPQGVINLFFKTGRGRGEGVQGISNTKGLDDSKMNAALLTHCSGLAHRTIFQLIR
jgi:hypothetical protein